MIASKLAGRTALLRRDPEVESVISWLSEQPEVDKIIPRAWRPERSKGKIGLRVDGVTNNRVSGSVFHGLGRQTVMINATDTDAAVALVGKAATKYGFQVPEIAKTSASRPVLKPTDGIALVPPPGTPMKQKEADHVADDAKVVQVGRIAVEVREITSDIALKWLEENTNNRPINERAVERYAKDMREGRWGVSDSVIAFDTKGRLINGQHRLWAVVESGARINQHVATGYAPEAITYFDDAYRRDNTQVYNMVNGTELTKTHMAIARRLAGAGWRLAEGMKANEMTRQDMFGILEKFKDGIDYAVAQLYRRTKGLPGLRTSGVLAVIARAFYTAKRKRLDEFCEVSRSGMAQSREDSAAIVLRNWLMSAATNTTSSAGVQEAYAKTERALTLFLKGEPLEHRLYAATEEMFPLPGEKVTPLPGKKARLLRESTEKRAAKVRAFHANKRAAKALSDAVN